jgi:hypothetical protein
MMTMYRVALLLAAAAAAIAQDTPELFKKAPPEVDEALRARVTQFFQCHVDGKFRQAEALVAEDTKDYFFVANKPKYLSFEISRIDYSDEFTRARGTVLAEQQVMMPGVGARIFKVPTPSRWKIEDGKWCWFVDPADLQKTPWGVSKVNPLDPKNQRAASVPAMPGAAEMQSLLTGVKADKSTVVLKKVGDQAEVKITNGIPGAVKLSMSPSYLGFDASIAKPNMAKGEETVLRIRRQENSRPGRLEILVEPINRLIVVEVVFE